MNNNKKNNYEGYILGLKFCNMIVTVLSMVCVFEILEPFYDVVPGVAAVNTGIIVFMIFSITIKFLELRISNSN